MALLHGGGKFAVSVTDGVGPAPEMDTTFDVQIVPGMDKYENAAAAKRGLTAALKPGGKLKAEFLEVTS